MGFLRTSGGVYIPAAIFPMATIVTCTTIRLITTSTVCTYSHPNTSFKPNFARTSKTCGASTDLLPATATNSNDLAGARSTGCYHQPTTVSICCSVSATTCVDTTRHVATPSSAATATAPGCTDLSTYFGSEPREDDFVRRFTGDCRRSACSSSSFANCERSSRAQQHCHCPAGPRSFAVHAT